MTMDTAIVTTMSMGAVTTVMSTATFTILVDTPHLLPQLPLLADSETRGVAPVAANSDDALVLR